jgi:phosphoesterase RecJ-like protein
MPIQWKPFVELVRRASRPLLTTHVRPDGDGLGSMRALGEGLEGMGKQVRMTVASVVPARYDFLNPDGRVERFHLPGDSWRDADLVVVLDTGTRNQLGDFAAFLDSLTVPKVVIDHHPTQDGIATLTLVDTTAEATGRLAHDALRALGCPLSPRMASALFTALAMDTGWFRFSNTTPATLRLAGDLVEAGAVPDALYERLFEHTTLARMKLMGLALDRLRLECGGRVAYTDIRRGDYAATGAVPQDTEDMVNVTRTIAGVEVGLFFMEQPRGGVKVSLRSRSQVDVGKIAEMFGGGGHRLASGTIIEAPLEEVQRRVLDAVRAALPS